MEKIFKAVLITTAALLLMPSCKERKGNTEEDAELAAEIRRLEAVEEALPAEEDYTDTLFGIPLEMVYVEGGCFQMGTDPKDKGKDAYGDEKPVHTVQLAPYYISRYEITQELWEAVMGSNPSHFNDNAQNPVETVSWEEACEFCMKATLMTGRRYALPTEAQWEYAAKGGSHRENYKYSGSDFIELTARYGKHETAPVGQLKPNALGIYDMCGNVWEWCRDWYGPYDTGKVYDPKGPELGFYRIIKGGGWGTGERNCRPSFRSGAVPREKAAILGFRVVMTSNPNPVPQAR